MSEQSNSKKVDLYDLAVTVLSGLQESITSGKGFTFKVDVTRGEELADLRQQLAKVQAELDNPVRTGVCETCVEKSVTKCDELQKQLIDKNDEITRLNKAIEFDINLRHEEEVEMARIRNIVGGSTTHMDTAHIIEKQQTQIKILKKLLAKTTTDNMGGTPDLFSPDHGGWDMWDDIVNRILSE